MPTPKEMLWFKQQFRAEIEAAVQDTPFTLDMLTAIASQETGEIWPTLRKAGLSVDRILELCVGDIIDGRPDGSGRKAFPKTKTELINYQPNGAEMFGIARQAFVDMAQYIKSYKPYVANPNKFCRGYGIFQLDLQFFKEDPDYFLQKRYANFGACLAKCIGELRGKLENVKTLAPLRGKPKLGDLELAAIAIAYNTGGYNPTKGLNQGYYNKDTKKFYGQHFLEYLRLAHTVVVPEAVTAVAPPVTPTSAATAPPDPATGAAPTPVGPALVAPPTPVEATGKVYEVDVKQSPLNLRAEPNTSAVVKTKLPDGQHVQAVSNKKVNGFLEVETSLHGAHFRGFASAQFLKPAKGVEAVPVSAPAAAPTGPLPQIIMPRKAGTLIKRADLANAHSLNEPGQPSGRKGLTPDQLRAELNAIIEWLAVDKTAHKRYQPRGKTTFCNIYAHDYCHLAGVYLPRVWWSPAAIERLAQGQTVQPLLNNTIDEVRANSLFHWLRDFGLRFGWRRTGDLAKLQQDANLGAVALIVARRNNEGLPGHITAVVPESSTLTARRNAKGEVIAPVQSQAGRQNFRRGTGPAQWWLGGDFAEFAFWVHA